MDKQNGCLDAWMEKIDGWLEGIITNMKIKQMDGWMDNKIYEKIDVWMVEWIEKNMKNSWMVGWTGKQMDG